ncbi:hypothetical protein DL240_12785 [Lujinxingia litoralis]|uniref:Uncharacterized protein n=1 Tax=Lujinxingia litoralis TaxID=2211119 RepID=A0A328C6H3_9DELT|nr:hypothetical protein [Lujinxingia litoralis]RAL21723.1 hypothetical protein DL240_12785 [Lujinxingia litoralis]
MNEPPPTDIPPSAATKIWAPLLALLASLIFALTGYRGTSAEGLAWIERSHQSARALREGEFASFWSLDDIFAADVLGAILTAVAPAQGAIALHYLGLVCGVIATLCVGLLARRAAGPIAGLVAGIGLLGAMPWLTLFSTHDPGAIVVTLILVFVALWSTETMAPWRIGAAALILALLGWSWLGAFALATALVATELLGDRDEGGGSILRLNRWLIVIFGAALFAGSPHFWPDPQTSLPDFFLGPLLADAPDLAYRAQTYPPARPPLSMGIFWWLDQTSPAVWLPLLAGLLLARPWRNLASNVGQRTTVALLLFACLLPWLARSPGPWGIKMGPLALAALAILGGTGLTRWWSAIRRPERRAGLDHTLALPAIATLAALLPPLVSPTYLSFSTYYELPLPLVGAPAATYGPASAPVLEVHYLRRVYDELDAPIDPAAARDLTDLYVRMGKLPAEMFAREDDEEFPTLIEIPQMGAGPTWRALGPGSAWQAGVLARIPGGGAYDVLLPPKSPASPDHALTP